MSGEQYGSQGVRTRTLRSAAHAEGATAGTGVGDDVTRGLGHGSEGRQEITAKGPRRGRLQE